MQGWVNPSFDDFGIHDVTPSQSPPKRKQTKLSAFPSTSQKRLLEDPNRHRVRSKEISSQKKQIEHDSVPWTEKHAPTSSAELAVHKKKVLEVGEWLSAHLCRKPTPNQVDSFVLLLSGPAGVGKTATVNTFAKEMKLTVQEWLNPATDTFDRDDFFSNIDFATYPKYRSQVAKFEEFLLRANKYQPLLLGQKESQKQVLLVEDIPNQLYRDSKLLHNIIRRFAHTSRCPLVFIISDSNSKEINVQSLFPKELITSLGICQINFNPVAPTSMSKTLTRIATAESSKGRHKFPVPSKSTIDAIAQVSGGDIRSAINALQFACLKDTGDLREVVESRAEDKKKKKKSKSYVSKNKKKGTGIDDTSLSAIGGKDTSLFLFRALGKILYCKREPKSESDPQLPFHLAHEERDKLIINPESIVERTHMTSENFTLYLHQNYLEFFNEIDDVAAVAQRFSEADHLTCQWEVNRDENSGSSVNRRRPKIKLELTSYIHRSILNQYSSSIATRGLIHHNTARRFHNVPSGGVWRPLHKPEWYEINRKYQDRCATSKALFIGEGCTPVDLQTQVIPFLALANVPLHDPAQISFLQEVGYFALQHFNTGHLGRRLNEKDLEQDEYDEDSIPSSQTRRNLHKPEIVSEQVDALTGSREEDIIIEDFVD